MFEGLVLAEKLGKVDHTCTWCRLKRKTLSHGLSVSDSVIYYELFVPEGERHDSAVKRNKEALVTELALWEGYLQKVPYEQHTHIQTHTLC